MNRLLSLFTDTILPIMVIIIAIVLAVLLSIFLRKKYNKPINTELQRNSIPQVKLKDSYCTDVEMYFLEVLHKALPRDCIAFPNVGISKIIEPKGNLIDFKATFNKYVDICVFLRKGMKPILVIDLYSPSPAQQQLKKFDDVISDILKEVKIPVLHKEIKNKYNIDELRMELLKTMNSTVVTYLKDKIIHNNVSK